MTVKVAINGFGRIGRLVARAVLERGDGLLHASAERGVAADHVLARTGAGGQRGIDPGEGAVDTIERGRWRVICHRIRIAWLHRGASLI